MMLKTVVSLCVFTVLALSTVANAQTLDRRTFLTVNAPLSLPGVTLPAGTYQFRLVDDTTTRRVLAVLNEAGTETFGLFNALPTERTVRARDVDVQLMETVEGVPPALQVLWMPGSSLGYEFVYPATDAARSARTQSPAVDVATAAPAARPAGAESL